MTLIIESLLIPDEELDSYPPTMYAYCPSHTAEGRDFMTGIVSGPKVTSRLDRFSLAPGCREESPSVWGGFPKIRAEPASSEMAVMEEKLRGRVPTWVKKEVLELKYTMSVGASQPAMMKMSSEPEFGLTEAKSKFGLGREAKGSTMWVEG